MILKLIFCKHTKLIWDLFMQVCPVSHHFPVSHSSWLRQPRVYGDEPKGCVQDGCKDLGRAFPLKGWSCKPMACFLVEDCMELCPNSVTINFLLFLTWIIMERFGLEGTLKIFLFQSSCHGRGFHPLDQVAHSLIQLGLDISARNIWSHSFSLWYPTCQQSDVWLTALKQWGLCV